MTSCRPSRFALIFEIPVKAPQRCEILFRGANFGHAFVLPADWGSLANKWTFNRGDMAITHEYWPPVYAHDSLGELIQHLEDTFSTRLT